MAEEKTLSFKQKLLELQKRIKPVKKEETNPYFNSKYFDINALLEEIKPHLNDLGLVLSQPLSTLDGKNTLKTMIYEAEGYEPEKYESEGKGCIESIVILPEIADVQKFGAALTYFRRYSLQSLLGVGAEDDDGNSTQGSTQAKKDPIFDEPVIQRELPPIGQAAQHFEGKQKAHGKPCNNCHTGVYTTSKQGKVYCDQKCWLNKSNEHPFE